MDAVVLCRLCYFDLSNVPEASGQTGIPLDECLKTYGDAIHPKGANGVGSDFFQEVSKTRCFGKAVARRYVDAHPDKDGTQFSATEYVLPKGPVFVSFRGTDGMMLGWREEFVDDLFNAIERAGSMTAQIADSVPDAFPKILAGVVGARPGSKVTAAKIPFRAFALGAADIVFVLMLVKPDALFVYASLAFGIMLAGAAVSCAHKARLGTHNSTAPTYNAIVTALLAMASAFVLVAPQDTFADCSFGLGITLLVCAIGALYEWLHEVRKARSQEQAQQSNRPRPFQTLLRKSHAEPTEAVRPRGPVRVYDVGYH